jgi:AcrR family transcriptional regulator
MDLNRPAMRPALTRDRIVEAAIALVDEGGPDALTMRAVAERLDAGAMSLYRHVSGREKLLDLVLAAMAAEIAETPLTGDWRTDSIARRGEPLLRPPAVSDLR